VSPRTSLRLKTFDYVGEYRCFFTLCTYRRRRLFTSAEIVDPVLLQFQQCAEREDVEIVAYCFMPNHLHLLTIGLTPATDSLRFIRSAKQSAGYWHAHHVGRPLWQRDVWDRVLRSNHDTMDVVRYILANPVQAGLVTDPFAYPFSGSRRFSREALAEVFAKRPIGSRRGDASRPHRSQ